MDDIGLKQTIMGSYFSDKMEVLNIQYHPQVSGDVERLSESQKVAIFRTLQEAVTNTLKHANAKHFYVDLHITPAMLSYPLKMVVRACHLMPLHQVASSAYMVLKIK